MGKSILIIDDEPEAALPLVRYLEQEGYTVCFAEGGAEALHSLTAAPPEMIICDFEMPAMDGFQALAAIASDTAPRDIPFILASGEWTLENMLRKAGGRAADTFFSKPYVVHEIAAFVRRIFKSIEEDRAEVPASRLCLQKEDVKTI